MFAGGTAGYIYGSGSENIVREITTTDVKYMFECHVDISAVQNGVGPAYAGGVFGYNCFRLKSSTDKPLNLAVVPDGYDYTVTAMQSASSSSVGNKYYNVCAGGYTSRLNIGYEVNNGVFYIGNGRITAYREVGSTAIGDVNAGGFAGRIMGYGSAATTIGNYDSSGRQSGSIDNLTIYFSGNSRVETLVVLSHKKPDSHLEVKIDFDNTSLDKTAIAERAEKRKPQEKTTYKKIQEWIEENYGFKVHTAYVAEVKRELGLPMYDAPNAVDELKRPRQHPTEQMTTAIKAALKHFEII